MQSLINAVQKGKFITLKTYNRKENLLSTLMN